jgi:spore photoproduct lyase
MVEKVIRKSMVIRPSGRSTDYLTPTIIMGCGFQCFYCYCKRHKTEGVDIANNLNHILTEIDRHVWFSEVEKPNQTHPKYISYDFGCNSDMALHAKHYDWKKVFNFFINHPKAMGSFATKYVNKDLLGIDPKGKIRIRFSLMPQKYANILEPKTSKIIDRIKAINDFIEAGYDVHINFSPVIVEEGWLEEYRKLFEGVDALVDRKYKDRVKAEVIFLTHNKDKHEYNMLNGMEVGEQLLWKPYIQESKTSQFGGDNIRYKYQIKDIFIKEWTQLHDEVIPWNTIRYIF